MGWFFHFHRPNHLLANILKQRQSTLLWEHRVLLIGLASRFPKFRYEIQRNAEQKNFTVQKCHPAPCKYTIYPNITAQQYKKSSKMGGFNGLFMGVRIFTVLNVIHAPEKSSKIFHKKTPKVQPITARPLFFFEN